MHTQKGGLPFVLIAEDDANDRLLIEHSFLGARLENGRHFVKDGTEAVLWLSHAALESDPVLFPMPGLVILDIHMPQKNGFEVLEWIRAQSKFRETPVIIMTGDDSPDKMERAMALGIHSYLLKAGDYGELADFVGTFNVARLDLAPAQ